MKYLSTLTRKMVKIKGFNYDVAIINNLKSDLFNQIIFIEKLKLIIVLYSNLSDKAFRLDQCVIHVDHEHT